MKNKSIIFILLLVIASFSVKAQSFLYELTGDPVDITGWEMGGDAAIAGSQIDLTPPLGNQNGYIYYETPQVLTGPCAYFTIDFDYRMQSSPTSPLPADGLAFWFLEDPPSGFVLGAGLGMPNVMKGFALILDVYNNDAVANNPIITLRNYDYLGYTEGVMAGLVGTELYNQTFVNDGTWRHIRMEYNMGVASVFLDGAATPAITGAMPLESVPGYFGFSASTGGSWQTHSIRDVVIAGAQPPEMPDVDSVLYCQGDTAVPLTVTDMIPGGNLRWYTDATGGTALPEAPTPNTAVAGVYTWYVSQSMPGCAVESARTPLVVTVRPMPTVVVTPDIETICAGSSVDLLATINPNPPDDETTYGWTPATSLSSTTILDPVAAPAITTTYYFTINTGAPGCEATDSVRINVIPADVVLLNRDTAVCAGTVLPLNAAGHTAYTYRWTPETDIVNPHSQNTAITARTSGTITLTASRLGCPDFSQSFYLEVQPVPDVDLGPDKVLCNGDTAQLVAGVRPSYDGYTYEWDPGSKLTDSTIKNPVFNGYSSETFVATVSTSAGCEGKDTIHVLVNSSDFASVNISDTGVCPITDIQLEATGAESYQWIPSEGLSNDTIPDPVASPLGSMSYLLLATSETGCVDSEYVNIEVYPEAVTTLPDSMEIWPGEEYEIDMVSNAHYFQWFPPEGLSDTRMPNPVASPDVRTRYFVDAVTEHGCTTKDSIDIVVNLESVFDIPNAFAPGNSNVNNGVFRILNRGNVTLRSFAVYDRWGQKVFETGDINKGWDGTFNDKPQPMGVYIYMIDAELSSGRRVSRKGNVTLIR